jgi:hypothetical protein
MAMLDEKQIVTETGEQALPSTPKTGASQSDDAVTALDDEPIDPKAERRLVWKLDLVIYPVFFVIYMMSFLDRINISNARIQGMVEDLDLIDNRFNIALFVSFDSVDMETTASKRS